MTYKISVDKFLRILILGIVSIIAFALLIKDMQLKELCWLSIAIVTVFQVALFNRQTPFNLFYIFMSAVAIFHFGLVLLYCLGMPVAESNGYDLFNMYSNSVMYSLIKFCIKLYMIIGLSGYLFQKEASIKEEYTDLVIDNRESIYSFGVLLFWVLLAPVLLYDITSVIFGIQGGYAAKFTYPYPILSNLETYFPFAIICITVGGTKDSDWKLYYYFAIFRLAVHMFAVGNRGPLVITFIIYELTRSIYKAKAKEKVVFIKWVKTFIVILVVIFMLSFVAVFRGERNVGIVEFFKYYNPISLFLTEFGSTLITPLLAKKYILMFGALAGKTFLGGAAIILPFSSLYLADIRSYMNIEALLNPYSPNEGALGGSVFGDLIINYDEKGIYFAIIIGIVVALLSNKMFPNKKITVINCLLIFISYGVLLYTRGNMQDIFLALKRGIYVWILYFCYNNFHQKKKSTGIKSKYIK